MIARATDLLAALDQEPLNLSRERTAILSGVSQRTVDRLIAAGSLKTTRIGRRVLIPRESLRALLQIGMG